MNLVRRDLLNHALQTYPVGVGLTVVLIRIDGGVRRVWVCPGLVIIRRELRHIVSIVRRFWWRWVCHKWLGVDWGCRRAFPDLIGGCSSGLSP